MKKIKMFLILLLITVVVIITKVHTCTDKTHNTCDGVCECDGNECIN